MSTTPKDHYNTLLETFRAGGAKIVHRKLKKAGGLYCHGTDTITIASEFKETLFGCNLLCHEISHREQYQKNLFRGFFMLPAKKMEFDPMIFDLILRAEMDAVSRADKLLKFFGIPYSPVELADKGYKESKEFWRNFYFLK